MTGPCLITVGLYVRNQARFIRHALASVLSQSYSPLEIVFSDDGSTDGTLAEAMGLINAYSGPHSVIVLKNPTARGPGGQINRIMEAARGELIVQAHGDDISLPNRVERIWDQWERGGRRAKLLYSAMTQIDANGKELGEISYTPTPSMNSAQAMLLDLTGWRCLGCASAFHRSVFDTFGRLIPEMMYEDRVLAVRARFLGPIHFIPQPLVRYRTHDSNISSMASVESSRWRRYSRGRRAWQFCSQAYKCHLRDLRRALHLGILDQMEYKFLRKMVGMQLTATALASRLNEFSWWRRYRAFGKIWCCRRALGNFLPFPRAYLQLGLAAVSPRILKAVMFSRDWLQENAARAAAKVAHGK
jgi:glycosyltransferase involved in cell wall biosynthesis